MGSSAQALVERGMVKGCRVRCKPTSQPWPLSRIQQSSSSLSTTRRAGRVRAQEGVTLLEDGFVDAAARGPRSVDLHTLAAVRDRRGSDTWPRAAPRSRSRFRRPRSPGPTVSGQELGIGFARRECADAHWDPTSKSPAVPAFQALPHAADQMRVIVVAGLGTDLTTVAAEARGDHTEVQVGDGGVLDAAVVARASGVRGRPRPAASDALGRDQALDQRGTPRKAPACRPSRSNYRRRTRSRAWCW